MSDFQQNVQPLIDGWMFLYNSRKKLVESSPPIVFFGKLTDKSLQQNLNCAVHNSFGNSFCHLPIK